MVEEGLIVRDKGHERYILFLFRDKLCFSNCHLGPSILITTFNFANLRQCMLYSFVVVSQYICTTCGMLFARTSDVKIHKVITQK